MENKSITSLINTALIKGEKTVRVKGGEYNVKNAFICINTNDVTVCGDGCSLLGNGNLLDIKNADTIMVDGFSFTSTGGKDFTVNITKSKNITFSNCSFSSATGSIVISDCENVTIKNCNFVSEKGNGICVLNASTVLVENSNFTLAYGEAITVVDNKDGIVTVHNNSFKRCLLALKSSGRNSLKITNNYFLTYSSAMEFYPSFAGGEADGTHKAEIRYNLFDECCKDLGEATVVIRGADNCYTHREITLTENIFSQKERPVINAKGVNYLIFKENNVRTNGESTVENSIINGIKA